MPFIRHFTEGKFPKETLDEFVKDMTGDKADLQCSAYLSTDVCDLA